MDEFVWAPRQMTWLDGSLLSVRRVTGREIAALPAAIIQPRTVRARSGPGLEYDVVARLPKGTWAGITDIGPQAEWLQIELVGLEEPVWVARDLTKVAGDSLSSILQIALKDDASLSPTVTYQR